MRFAFADPPYLGQGQRRYGYPEWDRAARHVSLLLSLESAYDGWAFCASSTSLMAILGEIDFQERGRSWPERKHSPLLEDMRIAAWVKSYVNFGFARPVYAWEPVLYKPLRPNSTWDWFKCPVTRQTGTIGAKPPKFCDWIFDLLGATVEDEMSDLFPGTGVVTARWKARQLGLRFAADL